MELKREPGFYWVINEDGVWVVAEYGEFYDWISNKAYGWHMPGKCEGYCENEYVCAPIYNDSNFIDIDENRILNPDEKP